jgi:hypothetical protein
MAYCYCFGRSWYFGPWDEPNDKPSAEAELAFLRQVQQWAVDPESAAKGVFDRNKMGRANGGPLFISLWADWRAAPGAINPNNGILDTCEKLLFFGGMADGMAYAQTGVGEFTLPVFSDWQERLCAKRREDGNPWYARATVQKHVSMILKCFQWGVQKGRVPFEQYAALKLLAPPPKSQARAAESRNVVGEEVVAETLDHIFPSAHPLICCSPGPGQANCAGCGYATFGG